MVLDTPYCIFEKNRDQDLKLMKTCLEAGIKWVCLEKALHYTMKIVFHHNEFGLSCPEIGLHISKL